MKYLNYFPLFMYIIYLYIKLHYNYKWNRFLLRLLVWCQHKNNETTLNSGSTAPMSSQYFDQHQDKSKTNIINEYSSCYKGITKSETEFISPSLQIFILKVGVHNTISDTSNNCHKQPRLFLELSLDLYYYINYVINYINYYYINYILLSKWLQLTTVINLCSTSYTYALRVTHIPYTSLGKLISCCKRQLPLIISNIRFWYAVVFISVNGFPTKTFQKIKKKGLNTTPFLWTWNNWTNQNQISSICKKFPNNVSIKLSFAFIDKTSNPLPPVLENMLRC